MRLEKVEIVGFKSFCDRQELTFTGGVTGIVGPNGCGKSNISDAISWVLGEQSVKSLRGSSMEDVIFAGSQSRQPLAMAEVNLKVNGLNGNSPDGNPECVITRRLYRNGESEYLMNDHVCRLRDIHELFMDTGLGSKAYSIIEQGKIGLILSSKPTDRRALIEEAAGITKYKARRKQTAVRLEAAQQNLLRVNDIVHEVEKQVESLKRQASKARRYRALREEQQAIERVLFGRRYLELRSEAEAITGRWTAESEREKAATVALESEEAHAEVRRNALYAEETWLEEARTRQSELTLAVDRHEAKTGYCKEQLAETAQRAAEARNEHEDLHARILPLLERLNVRRGDALALRTALDQSESEARDAERGLGEAAAAQAAAEQAQDHAREIQIATLGRIAALQNARESVSGNAERAEADLLKLAAEFEEMHRERAQAIERREAAQQRSGVAQTLVTRLFNEREQALLRGSTAQSRLTMLGRTTDTLESERDSLEGRRASLEEIVATHAAFDDGVRAALAEPGEIRALGVLADFLETDSAHERVVESFLGDRLQTVLTPDAESALRGIRHLEASGAGRATFLPVEPVRETHRNARLRDILAVDPRAKGLLSDRYRVGGLHEEAIRAWLPDALIVETLEDGLELVERHGAIACATLEGHLWRECTVEGGRAVKGLLAPRREIREILARQEQIAIDLERLRESTERERAHAATAQAEARTLEERIHAAEKDLVAIQHDLATAEEEASRLQRKAAVLDVERQQAEEQRGSAAVRLAEIEQALTSAEAEREMGSQRLASAVAAVATARAANDAAQIRLSEVRTQVAALRERVAAVESECARLEEEHRELIERMGAADGRAGEMGERQKQLGAELKETEQRLAETLIQRDRVSGEVGAIEDRVRDLRQELEGWTQSLKERRRERETLRDALAELEVTRARNGSDLDHLARESHQAVGVTAAESAGALSEDDKVQEVAGLEAQVVDLRGRLDRMGPVNVLAVEQSQELEERHQFLTAQRQDLNESIAELERAIRTIDKTSKERFREAFQVINQHFSDIFRQLFGGGTAGLSLLDEEDLLESGIDVMAQPPGKRLQNVMLLSGGEKALTAIALLFAIFNYKPSPFCILDEVDAPLDDANIGRFVRMLEGLKTQTQFVLITHSRKTMEIADQLYGVTMEEPGVSKLVSVRFS